MNGNSQKFCTKCGAQLDPDSFFCAKCGTPTANAAMGGDPQTGGQTYGQPQAPINPNISFKEYVNTYAPPFCRKEIRNACIVGYICIGLSGLVSIALNPLGLIDVLVFLGLYLGVHLAKSKACAILALVLSGLEILAGLVLTGTLSGWLWIVAGACAVSSLFKANKHYKAFKAGANGNMNYNNNDFR